MNSTKHLGLVILALVIVLAGLLFVPSPSLPLPPTGLVVHENEDTAQEEHNQSTTREEADFAITQAIESRDEMIAQGFGVSWVEDMLLEIQRYREGESYLDLVQLDEVNETQRQKINELLSRAESALAVKQNFTKVVELAQLIVQRKDQGFEIYDSLAIVSELLQQASFEGLDVTEPAELFAIAQLQFQQEQYEQAILSVQEIETLIEDIRSQQTLVNTMVRAGKQNVLEFVDNNKTTIIYLSLLFIIMIMILLNRLFLHRTREKIKDMHLEKEVLHDLIQNVQRKYYVHHKLSKKTYHMRSKRYRQRLTEIKHSLPVLEAKEEKLRYGKRVI